MRPEIEDYKTRSDHIIWDYIALETTRLAQIGSKTTTIRYYKIAPIYRLRDKIRLETTRLDQIRDYETKSN